MARTDNLNNFLTDVANSIREKKGTTELIPASDFDTEIESIETGGGSTVTKGIIINECDENGFATDVSIVGMTSIPNSYFQAYNYDYANALNKFVKNIQLPSRLTSIGGSAFRNCKNLALTELPSGVTSIDQYAFYGCTNLALTSLPAGLTSIRDNTFHSCTNLALTELPAGLTSIGIHAFFNCTNLALTSLPAGLTSIGGYAFKNCANLALTSLPEGITKIVDNIFYGCVSLTEMTCLGNITTIKSGAFYNCTKLSKFALPNITSVPTLSSTNNFYNTPIANGKGYIYVPDNLVESFKSATNWGTYADQIKAISEMGASA